MLCRNISDVNVTSYYKNSPGEPLTLGVAPKGRRGLRSRAYWPSCADAGQHGLPILAFLPFWQKCQNWKSCKQSIVAHEWACNKLLAALPIFACTFGQKVHTLPLQCTFWSKSTKTAVLQAKSALFVLFGQFMPPRRPVLAQRAKTPCGAQIKFI